MAVPSTGCRCWPQNDFFPDLASIPADVCAQAKLLVLNYPNSPTGKLATRDFYQRVIEFAQRNQIVVVQDAAHILLSYGPPLSFLSVPGEGRRRGNPFHVEGLSHDWLAARVCLRA